MARLVHPIRPNFEPMNAEMVAVTPTLPRAARKASR
jgi:hypothetical protein